MTQFTNLNSTSLITFAVLKMVPKSALWRFETSAYLWQCSIVDTYVPIWCRYLVQNTARRCFVRILLPGFHVCSCRVKLILIICLPFDWCLVPIISVAVASSHLSPQVPTSTIPLRYLRYRPVLLYSTVQVQVLTSYVVSTVPVHLFRLSYRRVSRANNIFSGMRVTIVSDA
jgi:hypothetical protein